MHETVLELNLAGQPGRLFAASDVHGSFPLLDAALEAARYDADADVVVLIGDLIDRGPQSRRCLEWIDRPRRHSLKGNHEAYVEGVCDGRIAQADHVEDGGSWFYDLSDMDRTQYRAAFMSLPLAARIVTPRGRRVGMIHADIAGSHFGQFCAHLRRGDFRAEQIALNGRGRINAVREGQDIPMVTDVDHVFFGHSPVPDPLTVGNCSWIDTGLPHSGAVTLVDVDEWIAAR
jgi:serine/threonine protein phosphatase 1